MEFGASVGFIHKESKFKNFSRSSYQQIHIWHEANYS